MHARRVKRTACGIARIGRSAPLQIAMRQVYCGFDEVPLVVTQKLPVSTSPKVESRLEFAQDLESGLRSDR
jgi:hypothetical protein